ncbi:unnamed protein product [Rhizophagus irregularis]|nr:unnamed protein product [Rhizophagus irregularis]
MSQPQIIIDSNEVRIVCRFLYYNIPGFCPNAKELQKKCQNEGHPLPCKGEASFSKIKIPNKVHQCDILLHTHDRDGGRVFVCTLLVIDVTTRFKKGRTLTSRNSLEIWIVIKDIYEDPSNPLTWPKLLMTDGDASF